MKKIFMIFLCSLFTISTNAANICVRPNVSMMVLDYGLAPNNVVGTNDPTVGKWSADFDFGTIRGYASFQSNYNQATGVVASNQDDVHPASSAYTMGCRCKIISPVVSKWIAAGSDQTSSYETHKTNCLQKCANLSSTMRRALFNNILLP